MIGALVTLYFLCFFNQVHLMGVGRAKTTAYVSQTFPANIYLFKVNNRITRKKCKICLKLTIKTAERCH